jgi:hypothetical protein
MGREFSKEEERGWGHALKAAKLELMGIAAVDMYFY